jgi:DNA-binding transcriptional MerR regulator
VHPRLDDLGVSENGLSIGSAARATGLSEDTLRYYERIGLMPKIDREPRGYRRYTAEHLEWVKFVTRMREAGMSIEKLLRYTQLLRQGDATKQQRRALLSEHAASIVDHIARLHGALETIEWKIARMDGATC